jgi:hypothetical protein
MKSKAEKFCSCSGTEPIHGLKSTSVALSRQLTSDILKKARANLFEKVTKRRNHPGVALHLYKQNLPPGKKQQNQMMKYLIISIRGTGNRIQGMLYKWLQGTAEQGEQKLESNHSSVGKSKDSNELEE